MTLLLGFSFTTFACSSRYASMSLLYSRAICLATFGSSPSSSRSTTPSFTSVCGGLKRYEMSPEGDTRCCTYRGKVLMCYAASNVMNRSSDTHLDTSCSRVNMLIACVSWPVLRRLNPLRSSAYDA